MLSILVLNNIGIEILMQKDPYAGFTYFITLFWNNLHTSNEIFLCTHTRTFITLLQVGIMNFLIMNGKSSNAACVLY